jgi:hypothetical protein
VFHSQTLFSIFPTFIYLDITNNALSFFQPQQ